MQKKRIAVGISGGVDSSVAAATLLEQGYDVTGVFIEAYNEPGCRTDQDKKDALQVALKLGIQFQTLDVRAEYKKLVVQYFIDEYAAGRTPNPDIVCNREVKFGIFYDWAIKQGFDFVATGHYARIVEGKLQRPKDLSKDQTYWLWQVEGERLAHILFPLGDWMKREVREKARELGLPNAEKPDSMGVCMMGELNVREWLKGKLGEKPGEVIWRRQELGIRNQEIVIGRHAGVWFATIGQRGGWEVDPKSQTSDMPSLYVIAKDKEKNQLIVGEREECYVDKFQISNAPILKYDTNLWVRIRNLGELTKVKEITDNVVTLAEPVFAVAPGQSAVFYDEDGFVVGGGVIERGLQ